MCHVFYSVISLLKDTTWRHVCKINSASSPLAPTHTRAKPLTPPVVVALVYGVRSAMIAYQTNTWNIDADVPRIAFTVAPAEQMVPVLVALKVPVLVVPMLVAPMVPVPAEQTARVLVASAVVPPTAQVAIAPVPAMCAAWWEPLTHLGAASPMVLAAPAAHWPHTRFAVPPTFPCHCYTNPRSGCRR